MRINRLRSLALCFLAALVAVTCSSCKRKDLGSLTVLVLDKLTRKPIKGAEVQIPRVKSKKGIKTDVLGMAHFYDVKVRNAGYKVTVKHKRYKIWSQDHSMVRKKVDGEEKVVKRATPVIAYTTRTNPARLIVRMTPIWYEQHLRAERMRKLRERLGISGKGGKGKKKQDAAAKDDKAKKKAPKKKGKDEDDEIDDIGDDG